jgi:RHS repeat-associated protein
VAIVYDGDGNRVSETVGGVTTDYLVDTVNPTGYAQVVDELVTGAVTRTYAYGLERISENQAISSTWTPSFYGYDGHGSVRQLTNAAGAVTDTYDYDAFGNLSNQTGSTPNNYLFAGEQFDPALGLYYNRARYYNNATGRFWSMDTQQGSDRDPLSLHKYMYAEGDPIDHLDPSGNQIDDVIGSLAVDMTLNALSTIQLPGGSVSSFIANQLIPSDVLQTLANYTPDAAEVGAYGQVNVGLNNPFFGATGFGGFELLGSLKTGRAALYGYYGAGLVGGSVAPGGGAGGNVGLVFNCPNSGDYTQNFASITVPQGALSPQIRARLELEFEQIDIGMIEGEVPASYVSILNLLSSITVSFSAEKAITFFIAPFQNPDGSRPLGVSIGAGGSLSLGASTSTWAVGGWSYYWQLAPSGTVPFE